MGPETVNTNENWKGIELLEGSCSKASSFKYSMVESFTCVLLDLIRDMPKKL